MYSLLSEIHHAGYVLDGDLKYRVEQSVSVQAKDARVYHPTFGMGTVQYVLGNYKIKVRFDNDEPKNDNMYYHFSREVAIHKLVSLDVLVRKEIARLEALELPKTTYNQSQGHGFSQPGKTSDFND
jgi:hypothetical protein